MLERQLDHIKPDMDVCDVTGDKVGQIAHVYRYAESPLGVGGTANAAVIEGRPLEDGVIEVKTGFLGLGSHLYIPFSAVQETMSDAVYVAKSKAKSKEEFARLGWQDKPLYFDRFSQTE